MTRRLAVALLAVPLLACSAPVHADDQCFVNDSLASRPYRLAWSVCYSLAPNVGQQLVVKLRNRRTGHVAIRRGAVVWHDNDLSTLHWRRRMRYLDGWIDYEETT